MSVLAATLAMMIPAIPHNFHHQRRVHHHKEMNSAIASYYNLTGTDSCGGPAQVGYGFANLSMPCGTRIRFCFNGNCVVGIMDDRGPYVAGRLFDLNVNLKYALRCPDLCPVKWRYA